MLLLSLACKAPPDAPTEMNELTSYLFMHMRDEDSEFLEAGMSNLQTWVENNWEPVQEGYRVQSLTTASSSGPKSHKSATSYQFKTVHIF